MTDVTPLIPAGRQVIQAYGENRFRISDAVHPGSVVVLPERVVPWPVAGFAEASAASILTALGDAVPGAAAGVGTLVLLIGCGPRMLMLPPAFRAELRAAGVVAEAMDTGAACRTYNVLLAEERRVAAALIAVP